MERENRRAKCLGDLLFMFDVAAVQFSFIMYYFLFDRLINAGVAPIDNNFHMICYNTIKSNSIR